MPPRSQSNPARCRRRLCVLQIGLCIVTMMARTSHALVSATKRIAVIGGGASGIFASIAAATSADAAHTEVVVLEATSKTLAKVKISGGGRCNVLHDTSKAVPDILAGYPRGRRELNGPYSKGFSPSQAQAWFERHGVTLKTEADGRMFPVTDSSQTVMDALGDAAQEAGVQLKLRCKVNEIVVDGGKLHVSVTEKKSGESSETVTQDFDSVILATGSTSLGYQLAPQLGHTIVSTVPSLFTLNAKEEIQPDGRFYELAGLSVPWARITLTVPGEKKKKQQLQEEGPLLITHHGLSGPAALRLSAFGARTWHDLGYQGDVVVHWAPHLGTTDDIFEELWKMTSLRPKKTIASVCPLPGGDEGSAIPRRLWASQCRAAGVAPDQVWGGVSKKIARKLAMEVSECVVHVTGKGQFKEEFGTCESGYDCCLV